MSTTFLSSSLISACNHICLLTNSYIFCWASASDKSVGLISLKGFNIGLPKLLNEVNHRVNDAEKYDEVYKNYSQPYT